MARKHRVSLTDIPDKILQDITRRVAKDSLHHAVQLSRLSKVFNNQWNSARRECALHQIPFVPLFGNGADVRRLALTVNTFRQNSNPKALFREGITNRFDKRRIEQRLEGLQQLEAAAQTEHLKSRYVYGLILVCGAGKHKQEGYDMLDTLMKPTLFESFNEIERRRVDLRNNYLVSFHGGIPAARSLLGGYVQYMDCGYGDNTLTFPHEAIIWVPNFGNLFENFDGCRKCFLHHQIGMIRNLIN